MIVDNVRLKLKAGNGGSGCVSFRREKYISHGGPDGGDGGKGGNIIISPDRTLNTLVKYQFKHKFTAQNGEDGKAAKCHGKNGEDLILKVPFGTIIRDAESGLVIKDVSDGNDYVLCKGGIGGWGNTHFANATRQVPRFAKPGYPGDEKDVIFELKLIADVGLIGFPNVGKSSLLSVISSAKPKIADYHFTTLSPNVGIVTVDNEDGFVVADIPGIIEGASDGAGLGHEFLRHIERCRLLVHVVDASGMEGRDPVDDYNKINSELMKFSPELANKKQLLVANKYDIIEDLSILDKLKTLNDDFVPVSAVSGFNIDKLKYMMKDILKDLPPVKIYESEYIEEEKIYDFSFDISRSGDVFYVEGEWLIYLINSINFSDRESVMYFQKKLMEHGVVDKLKEMGITEGDMVSIYDIQFDFVE